MSKRRCFTHQANGFRALLRDGPQRPRPVTVLPYSYTLGAAQQAALTVAKAQADSANNAKSRFLAFASHDLRQPLNAAVLYLETIDRRRLNPVDADSLRKAYGDKLLYDGLNFKLPRNGIVGVVGPNGAGKTSTVETLEGYRRPNSGSVRVLGLDPVSDHRRLVERIGVTPGMKVLDLGCGDGTTALPAAVTR